MNQLTINAEEFGLEKSQAEQITSGLTQILTERKTLSEMYEEVIKLEITQENIPKFKELRLSIRDNRTKGIEAWHKVNKEFYLRGGQFVDAIKRKEVVENERMEANLKQNEDYFENLEKERLAQLQVTRVEMLKMYIEDADKIDLSSMQDDVFEAFYSAKKKAFEDAIEQARIEEEARIEAEKKAEQERIAEQERLKKEAEAQRLENERLRKEAEQREKLMSERNEKLRPYINLIRDYNHVLNLSESDFKIEMDNLSKAAIEEANLKYEQEQKVEAERIQREKDLEILKSKARREQLEREKVEAELKAKQEAELKAENERKALEEKARKEAEKAAKAPIKTKMNVWVNSFELPSIDVDNEKTTEIKTKFEAFKSWALTQIETL